MKKKPIARKKTAPAKVKADGLAELIAEVRQLVQSARRGVSSVIDTFQVLTNFEIGRRIVMREQKGEKRAEYGKGLIKGLSQRLTEEFGRGFSEDNLSNMRKLFLLWEPRVAEFPNSLFGNSTPQISETASRKFAVKDKPNKKGALIPNYQDHNHVQIALLNQKKVFRSN